jgi:uncharacterized membrane protein YhaH (DUF805 family)
MNFGQAIVSGLRNGVRFSGRATRSEYWYFYLFTFLASIAGEILDNVIGGITHGSLTLFNPLVSLALFIPGLAVEVRRLHDVDRSGWWLLMYFTIIGIIYPLLVWKCTKGTDGPNRFGPDEMGLGSKAVEVFS